MTARVARGQDAAAIAERTPPSGQGIALDRRGGDAWTWQKRLTGTCRGIPPEATIALRVGGEEVAAERDGDAFAAVVPLRPGENEIVAAATLTDGREVASAPVVYTVRLTPRPTARIAVRVAGDALVFDGSGSEPSESDGSPIKFFGWSSRPDNPAPIELRSKADEPAAPMEDGAEVDAERVTLAAPAVDGEYHVALRVVDGAEREDVATAAFVVAGGVPRAVDPVLERSRWIEAAVVSGVVPWAFGDEGFRSVSERLDDLGDLGVAALWFAPITPTPHGRFGYEVLDYFDVREEYGTLDDFRELVRQAHARGIRVLLDVVPNHTSIEHRYARDAAEHGSASAYHDFYDRDEGGTPTHYFDWRHLPNLNYANPEVRRFLLEALAFWVRDIGVDGFRVDAVWGIRERQPEWLAEFLAEIKRLKPDALIIAEASARDPFYAAAGFDAAYDWTDDLGHWAWDGVFGGATPIGQAMTRALTADGAGYHPRGLVFRFLNNNDTGDRFVTVHGPDYYRVALTMLLTLPGLPCLFTGDEVGAEFLPYGTTMPIDWGDRFGLRPYVKRLIALRREQPSLHAAGWTPLAVEPVASCFGFLRHRGPNDPPVLVLLNFSGGGLEARVPLPARFAGFARGGTFTDLLSGEALTVPISHSLTVPVPGWGARVLIGARA